MYKIINSSAAANQEDSAVVYIPGKLLGVAVNVGFDAPTQISLMMSTPVGNGEVMYERGTTVTSANVAGVKYIPVPFDMPIGGNSYFLKFSAASTGIRQIAWYYEDSPAIY
ncbi:hypothetical protein [Plectonema phage Pbo-yong3]|uniref:hypothetical protein n=1 Tax=Plectonema phage Pbo-yong3 TaxID=2970324 RepID=UPI00403D4255|nr:hypothetical protein [Plectonema phage Pbo-yong3]